MVVVSMLHHAEFGPNDHRDESSLMTHPTLVLHFLSDQSPITRLGRTRALSYLMQDKLGLI